MCENLPEQVQRLLASNNTETMGTFETLASIARKQGFKQLFSGLSINYLKVRISIPLPGLLPHHSIIV